MLKILKARLQEYVNCELPDVQATAQLYSSHTLVGEGSGNQLQYSCLENLRNGGAWWAAVYGVAQSQTRLKRLKAAAAAH